MFEHEMSYLILEDFIECVISKDKQSVKKLIYSKKWDYIISYIEYYDQIVNKIKKSSDHDWEHYHFNNISYRGMIFDFIKGLLKILSKKEKILSSISEELELDIDFSSEKKLDQIILLIDIFSFNVKDIDMILLNNNQNNLKEIRKDVESVFQKLTITYWSYKYAMNNDYILTGEGLIDKQKFSITEFNRENDERKIVYLDTNIFSYLMEPKNKNDLETVLSSKDQYAFCYSAYVIEDKIKQNLLYRKGTVDLIKMITDNLLIHHITSFPNQRQKISYEDPKFIYERVKLWEMQTRFAEQNKFNKFQYIKLISTQKSISPLNHFKKDNEVYCDEVVKWLKVEYQNEVENIISNNSDSICNKIRQVLEILDQIDFGNDSKNIQKSMSSFEDDEHLKVAHCANIFVTSDKKMINRAKVTYSLLNLDIEVMSYQNFIEMLNDSK